MSSEQGFDPAAFNRGVIDEFRANNGRVEMFAGAALVLLTSTGARSGHPRTVPLASLQIEGETVVIASKAGADTHPDWYFNIVADPRVTVELGVETFPADAHVADERDRDRLFSQVVALASGFGDYQAGTARILPVVTLRRAPAGSPAPEPTRP